MESVVLPTERKIQIGRALISAGIRRLEATSFVSATVLPQLADAAQVIDGLRDRGAELQALVPNLNGARRAAAARVNRLIAFMSASETHNVKNVRRPVAQSIDALAEIAEVARTSGLEMGGAIATVFGCPYEGNVSVTAVARIVEAYMSVGVLDIALGDTTGMATPNLIEQLLFGLKKHFPAARFALHFHNTRGLGLVNVMRGVELGVDRFESSIGGLGGCPFAVGATGNVCTEDMVHMMDELGIETGVDLERLISVAKSLEVDFQKSMPGQVMKAGPRLPTCREVLTDPER